MKILFTSEEVVDICNSKYYSLNLGLHLTKYSYMGAVTCVCYSRKVASSKLPEIDKKTAEFVFTEKETSPLSKFTIHKHNHELIMECAKEADAIVAHVPSWNSEHSIKIAKELNKPFMVVVVGCIWDSMWNFDWRGKIIALNEFLKMRRQVASAKYALYVTEFFLQKRYPCKGLTEHASNVCIEKVDESVLAKRLERIASYTDGQEINIATAAGVDVRYKGQQYVIRALEILNKQMGFKYHYYIIGNGDQTYLRNVAKSCDVEKYVHFTGPLKHGMVTETFDKMDLYIQPSNQEGLPRALIEAMSRALPAVGTKVAGIPELLPDDYLVCKGSVKDIANVLSTKMSQDSMKMQAQNNFIKASNYTIDIINTRRQKFFDAFRIQNSLI